MLRCADRLASPVDLWTARPVPIHVARRPQGPQAPRWSPTRHRRIDFGGGESARADDGDGRAARSMASARADRAACSAHDCSTLPEAVDAVNAMMVGPPRRQPPKPTRVLLLGFAFRMRQHRRHRAANVTRPSCSGRSLLRSDTHVGFARGVRTATRSSSCGERDTSLMFWELRPAAAIPTWGCSWVFARCQVHRHALNVTRPSSSGRSGRRDTHVGLRAGLVRPATSSSSCGERETSVLFWTKRPQQRTHIGLQSADRFFAIATARMSPEKTTRDRASGQFGRIRIDDISPVSRRRFSRRGLIDARTRQLALSKRSFRGSKILEQDTRTSRISHAIKPKNTCYKF